MWKHAAGVAVVAESLGMTMLNAAAADPMIFVDPVDYMPPPPYAAATTFVVPVEVTGAVDLISWQFDLTYDPADVQIVTNCDPFSDPYCNFDGFGVTEGPFFGSLSPFNVFNPGFVLLTGGSQTGRLLAANDTLGGEMPPSGAGILAFVEFTELIESGTAASIAVANPSVVSAAPEPATLALLASGFLLLGRRSLLGHQRRWSTKRSVTADGDASQKAIHRNPSTRRSDVNHVPMRTAGLITVTMLAFSAAPIEAVTTGPGSYYATPSWDQQLPVSTRFVVLSNWIDAAHPSGGAAVLDRETGLVWEQSPDATLRSWGDAQRACMNKNVGGRGGWKLPSIQELRSLVDPASSNPALPAGHPFTNTHASYYWSATTFVVATDVAWFVNLSDGSVDSTTSFDLSNFVWCVRGSPGADGQ